VNRIGEMNTALVRLKVEMETIIHAASAYQTEFDTTLKFGKIRKDVFLGINETVDELIR
jgi:hypothetical protein